MFLIDSEDHLCKKLKSYWLRIDFPRDCVWTPNVRHRNGIGSRRRESCKIRRGAEIKVILKYEKIIRLCPRFEDMSHLIIERA